MRNLYIFKDRSAYSAGKYGDQSWKYINRSQTHVCGNWVTPFLFWVFINGIFVAECPLSQISVPCLHAFRCPQSYVSVPCIPSSVSQLCSLSLVLCTLSHVIWSLSPILLSSSYITPINFPSVPFSVALILLFLSFTLLFPVLCSSVSCPLFLVFHIAIMRVFLKNRHAYTCNRRFCVLYLNSVHVCLATPLGYIKQVFKVLQWK